MIITFAAGLAPSIHQPSCSTTAVASISHVIFMLSGIVSTANLVQGGVNSSGGIRFQRKLDVRRSLTFLRLRMGWSWTVATSPCRFHNCLSMPLIQPDRGVLARLSKSKAHRAKHGGKTTSFLIRWITGGLGRECSPSPPAPAWQASFITVQSRHPCTENLGRVRLIKGCPLLPTTRPSIQVRPKQHVSTWQER